MLHVIAPHTAGWTVAHRIAVFERALTHGDEHVIKLTDAALDVGDEPALAAALRSMELSAPLG